MKSGNKVLVIGGYRGIGFRLAKLYLYNGDQVFVTYSRLKPKDYTSKNISFLKLELNNHRKFMIFIKQKTYWPILMEWEVGSQRVTNRREIY